MKKRLLSLLLAAACLMPLSGCDWGEEPEETYDTLSQYYQQSDSTKQDTRLTSFGLPYLQGETWDPITCADGAQQTLGALLYESLYKLGTDFLPQPCLAESASYDAESYALTVTVRSGVTFSDGSALTAWDVVAALRRAKESVRYGQRLAEMDSVSYLGESTLRIYLTRNDPQFAARLDIPVIKGGTQEDTVPVGSGPYRYAKDESGVYLARRTDWWQDKTMPLERIELTACKNTDSMAYAFYTHDIQMLVCDLTGTNTSNVYGSGSYTDIPTSTMQYIGFNVTRAPFNDPKLRAALSLGMDRAGGVSAFLLGHGQTAQFPLSPSAVVYPKDLEETYSPDSYRSAMETAGYTSGEKSVSVTMLVNEENSFKVSMARKLASDLSQYDVKIDVKTLPYEDYLAALKAGDFDLYYGECRLTADWDLSPLLSPGGALNYGGVRDTQLETLLTAFRTASEGEGRQTAARELCSYLKEQAPLVAVCFKSNSVLLPDGAVKNDIHPTVSDPFADFQDWQLNMKS